ncbi:MAG: hypothetical protein SGBAC_012624 [Bacillariaceae sp.]
MTFGIPIKNFPISIEGQLKNSKHKGWLQRRKQKERFLKTNPLQHGAVDMPIKFDVLLGKGMPVQEHAGNKYLHELVALRFEEYDSAKRKRKTEIAEEVVRQINQSAGRFLTRDDDSGMWVEVPSREAQDKAEARMGSEKHQEEHYIKVHRDEDRLERRGWTKKTKAVYRQFSQMRSLGVVWGDNKLMNADNDTYAFPCKSYNI